MPRTIVHIGAHKTATTYMQKKLTINKDELAAAGIHYDPLDTLRKNFTNSLQDPAKGNREFVAGLRQAIKAQEVIVSEENLPGVPGDLVRSGLYYFAARERLATVGEQLGLDAPEVFMALREYSGFLVSMYCEYIRHQKFIHFDDYFERYRKSGFTWVNVIGDIAAALPGAKIRLWDFGRFRTTEKDVFAAMLGRDPSFLKEPEGPVRESFSDAAIRAFEALSGVLTHQEMKPLINPVARALPKGELHPAFNPLAADVIAALKDQYRRDLQEISEKFPAVEFIGGV